jgi:Domain of Unknown Function (DUF1080)
MRGRTVAFAAALFVGAGERPLAVHAAIQTDAGWVMLLDGTSLDQWNVVGDANWKLVDGVVQADGGSGFLVSKISYGDFQLRVEFWVDTPANSGVFLRCSDPANVTAANAYEVNIFDTRPDPTYGTGAIVNVAKVSPMPKAGGQWNTFEIAAQGPHLTVTLNGTRTSEGDDSKHARGPIALQHGAGIVKFRKVQIKPL